MTPDDFLTPKHIAEITGGELTGAADGIKITDIVIDDREAGAGSLYVPIIGERFDGHAFIERAVHKGVPLVLSDRELAVSAPYIRVADTLEALQLLAAAWKAHYHPFTVAVTGSVGKTTTKEMIAQVLAQGLETHYTRGNLNNQTGVPKTVFAIGPETQAAVIEMGMNHAGEIDRIARIAAPDVGVITNIGTAHIEYLGSQDGIFKAKTELLPHMQPDGCALVNGDDPYLAGLKKTFPRTLLFGLAPGCDVRAESIEEKGLDGTDLHITLQDGAGMKVHIPAPGHYMIYAALAAAACGLQAGLVPEQIREGIASYTPAGSRMRITAAGSIRILDDTYNANAPAMKEALRVLASVPGRKIAILGDMRELGKESERLHREVGKEAGRLHTDVVIAVGEEARYIAQETQGHWFGTQEELREELPGLLRPGDTVLVKGSRGMQLEKTVEAIQEIFKGDPAQ